MKRHDFLLGLALPPMVCAMPAASPTAVMRPLVGFVAPGTTAARGKWVADFVRLLAEPAWVDGKTVTLDFRCAGGDAILHDPLGEDLARLKPVVFVSSIFDPREGVQRAAPETPYVLPKIVLGLAVAKKTSSRSPIPAGLRRAYRSKSVPNSPQSGSKS